MDVSVIIVTYNTLALTRDCIDSIFRHTANVQFEVIVVDNASEDGSYDYFSKDRRIIYVYSQENMGFGRANNLGLEYASGEYIFLLNSDTYLKNNAIKIFKEAMDVARICCVFGGDFRKSFRNARSFVRPVFIIRSIFYSILEKYAFSTAPG